MGTSSRTIAVIAAISTIWPNAALPQGSAGTIGTGTNVAGTTATTGARAAAGATAPAPAQGGLQFDIGVSSKLTVDDNFQLKQTSTGTSTIWDNRVDLNLSSVTGVQDFSLNGSGVFRYADIPGRSISGFEDPTIRLRYRLDGVNSRLTLTGRYRFVDREFLDPFQIEQEETNFNGLYAGGGTVTFKNAALNYVTGINDPLTFTLDLGHDEKDYDSTAVASNPRLFDTESDSIDANVSMKVSPLTSLRLSAGLTDYSANDPNQTRRKTTDYAIGVVQDINPVLVLDAQVGYTEVETDTVLGTRRRDGATGAVTLTQTLPNGSVFAALDSALNQNGTRTTLRFGRDLQLPLGNLRASVGGTKTPGGDTYVVATVAYSRQLKSSDITVSLNRAVSTNNINEDVLDTRLTVGYGYEIDANSRINLALNWGRSESAGIGAAPTIERTTLRASYSRDLTQDWAMTGGVQLRKRTDSTPGVGDADSNSVFLSLDRTFNFRP
ncbi:hypothetical protein [Defluviimonas sp. SAOS-178_SWC]|uniref:hypothetical protein n=1 Tax=Defluviimonas sp. SAOS-178_SWC TaxID=3121287 RepID=UPI0032216C9E